jgi:hypothetical protein
MMMVSVTISGRKICEARRLPEMTQEEHKRRGDGADALFREMQRRIAEKL